MEPANPPKERPIFLTIVCILSYVLLGMSILNGLVNAIFGRATAALSPFIQRIMERDVDLDNLPYGLRTLVEESFFIAHKAMEFATTMAVLSTLMSVIALFGVISMWQLKKTGFYLYTGAKIFILLIPFIFLGFNFISYIVSTVNGVFVILFIILYAVNFKHMK